MTGRTIRMIGRPETLEDPAVLEAVATLRASGHEIQLVASVRAGHAVDLARRTALSGGVDVLVAAGGDGTVNEVVNGVMEAGAPEHLAIAVLPLGTANDFAVGLAHDPDDVLAALVVAATEPAVPVDVGRANGRYFINMVTAGFGAEITRTTPPELKRFLGGLAYLLHGLLHVERITPRHARIRMPDDEWEGEFFLLFVGNGRQSGGGFELCPAALLDDGLLDVVVVPEVPTGQLLPLFDQMIRPNRARRRDRLRSWVAPWVEVEATEELHVNLDGEPTAGTHFRFEVVPRAIRLVLPPGSPLLTSK